MSATPSDPGSPPVAGPAAPVPVPRTPPARGGMVMLALVAAAIALVLSVTTLRQNADLARQLEQARLAASALEQGAGERERRLAELERQWAQAQAEADVAGGQVTDSQVRARRELLALIDIERLVDQAQLHLRMGGSVTTAVDALAVAEARLGRIGTPVALRIQTALRHDLVRLHVAPDTDRGALAVRLDALLPAVEEWHVLADPAHALQPAMPAVPGHAPATAPRGLDAGAESASTGARVRAWLSREFGDLLRIREVATPEPLLLDPEQQQLVRARVRLGILNLRQALLARDERTIRTESAALEDLLSHYFDAGQPGVAAAIAQVRATAAAAAAAAPPSLEETLGALRAVRGAGEG